MRRAPFRWRLVYHNRLDIARICSKQAAVLITAACLLHLFFLNL